ncbi:unnamed protein product [Lasius platythorax]|uniref:Uncharacterized protein n=1 Tax=Lasius platythorax TaxID=488582 RepID=A0AAV2N8U3_9HYME
MPEDRKAESTGSQSTERPGHPFAGLISPGARQSHVLSLGGKTGLALDVAWLGLGPRILTRLSECSL